MSEPPTTCAALLSRAKAIGVDRLDAQLLLSKLLGQPRSWLLAHDHDLLPPDIARRVESLLRRRAHGEPLAYLLGEKEFFGLALRVSADVLVPRPDTETLVEWALECLGWTAANIAPRVLDLGTGSGAIALAIKSRRPDAVITAVDASAQALAVAADNATRLGLPIRTLLGSWFAPVASERFDLIVSNPPYIAEDDEHLSALQYEPRQALTAGPDGLEDLRTIVGQAPHHLSPGGWLLLEHGWDQAPAVAKLLQDRSFVSVVSRPDLGGNLRCTGGQTQP